MSAEGLQEHAIVNELKRVAKNFVFQLEQGTQTGYRHYQGRLSLIKKARKSEVMLLWKKIEIKIPFPNYFEPTSCEVYRSGDFCYQTKEDTRIAGPWSDKDEEVYVPRQFKTIMENLYPYQQKIYESADVWDPRTINIIYCPKGNIGKSTIANCMELFRNGISLPPVNDAEKLVASMCDICVKSNMRKPSPVFIDMPRAMSKEKLFGVYSAIEQIKNGKLYDLRYKYQKWWIDSPVIWVFTNILPDLELLSLDRWKIWTISENKELLKFDINKCFVKNEDPLEERIYE